MTFSRASTLVIIRPIISVCVPTFNRANCLDNLLRTLEQIVATHGAKVEICISNNQSTDGTADVIESWRARLGFKVLTQSENIGATPNAFAVSGVATGKWILLVGDDDELIPSNFANLLALLQSSNDTDWILVGVADASGREHLLGDVTPGRHDAESFRRTVLRTGLYRFGFIGMHVFPAALQPVFAGLSLAQGQPWPHLALLLRHLQCGHVQVFPAPIVSQAAGGAELFWKAGDWVHANLRKLNIVAEARRVTKDYRWFFNALILRELYSLGNMKNLIGWKIREPNDFFRKAFAVFIARYTLLGPLAFLAIGHSIFLLAMLATPTCAIRKLLHFVGKRHILDAYVTEKQAKSKFDGVNRGL